MFALMTPVITSTEGRCVAMTRWIPTARAICAIRQIDSSTSRAATIMRSFSSSTTIRMNGNLTWRVPAPAPSGPPGPAPATAGVEAMSAPPARRLFPFLGRRLRGVGEIDLVDQSGLVVHIGLVDQIGAGEIVVCKMGLGEIGLVDEIAAGKAGAGERELGEQPALSAALGVRRPASAPPSSSPRSTAAL